MIKFLQDIYFYNAKALATELRNGSISEYRAVKHLIASIILGGIGFDIPISASPEEVNTGVFQFISYIIFFAVSAVISYYGVWLTYQVNKKGDGRDYFLRFSVLTLPVGIQLVVLFFGVGLILVALTFVLFSISDKIGYFLVMPIFFLATLAFIVMFFIRMRNFIAIAAGVDE